MHKYLIAFFVFFILVLIRLHIDAQIIREKFVQQYLHHKSKCFSCEKQMIGMYGPDAAWLANPTKGFDDEKEGVRQMNNIRGGFLAKTIKYY